ncbi:MAG: type III pantothenate kinase [Ginsengibacter sp.]
MNEITICFDFGNSRLKYGVFEGDQLKEVVVMHGDDQNTIEEIVEKYHPRFTILSSVINHDPAMEILLADKSSFLKLDASVKLPFTIPVSKPETMGADRIALAAYAVQFARGKNNLVIALGTCITYNFINKYNSFNGGSISPGLEMRFKSLHDLTAALPLIKLNPNEDHWDFPLIGYDTKTNILSGVVLGMVAEIDGIIDAYKEKFGNFNALLTGGDVINFAHHLKNKIFADPHLVLKGLYAICKYNHDIET